MPNCTFTSATTTTTITATTIYGYHRHAILSPVLLLLRHIRRRGSVGTRPIGCESERRCLRGVIFAIEARYCASSASAAAWHRWHRPRSRRRRPRLRSATSCGTRSRVNRSADWNATPIPSKDGGAASRGVSRFEAPSRRRTTAGVNRDRRWRRMRRTPRRPRANRCLRSMSPRPGRRRSTRGESLVKTPGSPPKYIGQRTTTISRRACSAPFVNILTIHR